jgi:uncharacterized protein YecT (DUF1311 family)
MRRCLAPILCCLALPVAAQDLRFDISTTESCLVQNGLQDGASADDLRPCIGVATGVCMAQPGGDSTYGMGFCLDQELEYWDAILNDRYQVVRRAMVASDTDLPPELGIQADSLRDMQRAWITYRDTRCGFEASLFQGGTGSSPAFLACAMQVTGEQALYLNTFDMNGG